MNFEVDLPEIEPLEEEIGRRRQKWKKKQDVLAATVAATAKEAGKQSDKSGEEGHDTGEEGVKVEEAF